VSKPDHYFNYHYKQTKYLFGMSIFDGIYYWNQYHEPSADGQVGAAWELPGP
jgi:hypothetical protein